MSGTVPRSQCPMCFTSYRNDVRDNRGSGWLLALLVCLHYPSSQLQVLKSCRAPLVCFKRSCRQPLLLPESFWSGACSCSISFARGMPLTRCSHLGLSSGNTGFPDTVLYLGSPSHCAYYMNSGSMTLFCCCREIQKPNCYPRLTGRQTGSSRLS